MRACERLRIACGRIVHLDSEGYVACEAKGKERGGEVVPLRIGLCVSTESGRPVAKGGGCVWVHGSVDGLLGSWRLVMPVSALFGKIGAL